MTIIIAILDTMYPKFNPTILYIGAFFIDAALIKGIFGVTVL